MKDALMKYLICPGCAGSLRLEKYIEKSDEIEEGLIECESCHSTYPVIEGIPRMLTTELLVKLVTGYEHFMKKYKLSLPQGMKLIVNETDEKIAKGFEFEWKHHAEILPEHELEFRHVLGEVMPPESFINKVVLDAGCGQGRFSYFSKKFGADTVIAFDLGEQTLISKKNLQGQDNVHILQASIYNPPFKPIFDIVYSIGVLHHLPDPEKGFFALYNLLNENGRIFVWLYGYSSIIPVIKFLRQFSLKLGVRLNRCISFFLAVHLYAINKMYNFFNSVRQLRAVAKLIPFHMYHDRGFSNIWTICFDKINSGIAYYYKKEELLKWINKIEDKKKGILSERYPGKAGSSWRLLIEK